MSSRDALQKSILAHEELLELIAEKARLCSERDRLSREIKEERLTFSEYREHAEKTVERLRGERDHLARERETTKEEYRKNINGLNDQIVQLTKEAHEAELASAALLEAFKIIDSYLETSTMPERDFDRYWHLFNQSQTKRAKEFVKIIEDERQRAEAAEKRASELAILLEAAAETNREGSFWTEESPMQKRIDAALVAGSPPTKQKP